MPTYPGFSFQQPGQRAARSGSGWGRPLRLFAGGCLVVGAWLRRCAEQARQRQALARLDDRLLRDIGLSPADAERETRRPFWRV